MKKRPRLYTANKLSIAATVSLSAAQAHYLLHVLRFGPDDEILLFNQQDGEFIAQLQFFKKLQIKAKILSLVRSAQPKPTLRYCFAPIKKLRLDYMIQKAVEMGTGAIIPVKTEYTQFDRLSMERMEANAIEAAEQCGAVYLPEIRPICSFNEFITRWDVNYHLIFCDEKAKPLNRLAILQELRGQAKDFAVLIGPEGGFSARERELLYNCGFASAISLGLHILRADTAAVAAMSLISAVMDEK